MTPSELREKVVTERVKWLRQMLDNLSSLPFADFESFVSDNRNIASAESYLRRAIEALLDLGRHVLARGFGEAVAEYKQIAGELMNHGVIQEKEAEKLRVIAGYRNRMVHFYQEISDRELYEICTRDIGDIENILDDILQWIRDHPERIDRSL
jgi:uncharacterized protein YutE (UPF0331/DUF86 family)